VGISYGDVTMITVRDIEGVARLIVPADILERGPEPSPPSAPLFSHTP
jgi:hypothetical protein